MQKKIVFYDLDGTLVDTRKDIALAVNHMVVSMGMEELAQTTVERSVGRGIHYLIENCLGTTDPKLVEKGVKRYRQHYTEHLLDNTVLYPEVFETLDYFDNRHQAVVTNKPDPFTTTILKALNVYDRFFRVIPGNSEYAPKPAPESVLALMEHHGIGAEDALFVGDSKIDLETGRNAGIDTVLISHGFASTDELKLQDPDYLVPHFAAFLELVKEKQW